MIALSIRQPWANLIISRRKPFETRTWATKQRGRRLIHASLKPDLFALDMFTGDGPFEDIMATYIGDGKTPAGAIIGVVDLIDCFPMEEKHVTGACCPFEKGKYIHHFANAQKIKPIPFKGKLGYYETGIEESDLVYVR